MPITPALSSCMEVTGNGIRVSNSPCSWKVSPLMAGRLPFPDIACTGRVPDANRGRDIAVAGLAGRERRVLRGFRSCLPVRLVGRRPPHRDGARSSARYRGTGDLGRLRARSDPRHWPEQCAEADRRTDRQPVAAAPSRQRQRLDIAYGTSELPALVLDSIFCTRSAAERVRLESCCRSRAQTTLPFSTSYGAPTANSSPPRAAWRSGPSSRPARQPRR